MLQTLILNAKKPGHSYFFSHMKTETGSNREIELVSIIPIADNCCCSDVSMDMDCCGNKQIVLIDTNEYLDKFTTVAGLRIDHHNLFGTFVTPGLHILLHL